MNHPRMSPRISAAILFSILFSIFFSTSIVHADEGPGLGNLTYTSGEFCNPIATIDTPAGEGAVAMHHGFLFVAWAPDSGQTNGGFDFYNMSNPRSPVRTFRRVEADIREPHGFGFSDSYTQGNLAVLQAQLGIQIWNFTNHSSPTRLSYLTLPGIGRNSDYDDGVWWAFWQAPYIYVGGSGNGLYVVDATNPTAPTLVRQVPSSTWGGARMGPVYAVGNLLVMSNNDSDPGRLVTMDISDPRNPTLIQSLSSPRSYSTLVNGERVFAAGAANTPELIQYRINSNNTLTEVRRTTLADKGGYLSVQDGFVHMGASGAYQKIDIANGAIPCRENKNPSSADWDFATALGNIALIGNDHGEGSRLVVHQTAPDNTGPSVNMVNPRNNATNQPLTSRVGITLTDAIEVASINSSNFIVRPVGTTTALAGKYSTSFGVVNFSPNSALQPGTTYEVVVTAGGMRDYARNGVASAFRSTFTTTGTQTGASCTLTIPRTAATPGSSVSFSPGSTTGTGLSYLWNFGDGATATTQNATHTYANPGHYAVSLRVSNATSSGTCSAKQTIHNPLTANPPRNSSTIAFDSGRNSVWVVNSDTNTVTKINNAASPPTKSGEFSVGRFPQTVARAPDGRIWVANSDSNTISVLNGDSGAVAQTINLPRGSRPFGVAFSPNNAAAYVTLQGTGQLLRFNPTTGAQSGSVSVGPSPRGIAISGDSARIFVTRFISPTSVGEVREVNASTMTVSRTITLRNDPGPDSENSGRGVPNYISAIAINPDGRRAWVPSKKDNTSRGLRRDGLALNFENTVRTIVSQIDIASTNAEVTGARIDLNDRDMANAVAFTSLGDYVFVSTQGTNTIEAVDAYSNAIVGGVDAQTTNRRGPRGLLVTPNNRLYMQNFISRTVSAFDIAPIVNGTSNNPTLITTINSVASETLPSNVIAGKRIFYNAFDTRMNTDNYISCASCHQDGGQDGRVMDFSDRGEGFRNTVELNGRSGMGQGRVHWTGNFNEIQDFCNDIQGPFNGDGFGGTCNAPLGASNAGQSTDLDNLAAFVTSLTSSGVSPFRNQDGSMTADAIAGQQLFQNLQCSTCHVPSTGFTDSVAGNDVRHNVGTIKSTSGSRLGQPLTGLDTPTLIGVWQTAPYLHDGSAATLLDVLTSQNVNQQHGNTAGLTSAQLNQLVAYMQQLEGSAPPQNGAITNLNVRDTANAADWSIQSNVSVGNTVFGDRTYTFESLPASVAGGAWIRAANDSKSYTGNPLVSFSITAAANVHVAADDRIGRPSWVDSTWVDTGENLVMRENATTTRAFSIFRKSFSAGSSVSLGPVNNAGVNMYVVIVKAGGTSPTLVEVTPSGSAVTASTHDGNLPANTVDNNLSTRWSANGDGQWIRFDLGSPETVSEVRIAFQSGNVRTASFDLQVSDDGVNFETVLSNAVSSGTTLSEETFDFPDETARYVRYLGHGNSASTWNSLTEVSIFAVN